MSTSEKVVDIMTNHNCSWVFFNDKPIRIGKSDCHLVEIYRKMVYVSTIIKNGNERSHKLSNLSQNSQNKVLCRIVEDLKPTNKFCPHCGRELTYSVIEGYDYQCEECDEDFVSGEVTSR